MGEKNTPFLRLKVQITEVVIAYKGKAFPTYILFEDRNDKGSVSY